MRILMKKSKQKELIEKFKDKQNFTWNKLANYLEIKRTKLMTYYHETVLIPDSIYKKLDKNELYKEYILEKKEDNWGRKKGGVMSRGSTKKIIIPEKSEKLAEFYGIMLGDGNSTRIKDYKIGTYMIRIVGDSRKDRDYLINFVKPLIEDLFKIKAKIGKFKNENAIHITAHSLELVNFLEKMGFKPGNKIKNKLQIPDWIKSNKEYAKVCLRGLYDTDGSFYRLGKQNSYQISFKNHNSELLDNVREGLLKLGIGVSNIINGKSIVITDKNEINKFYKLIGFHNPKHLNKIEMWKIALSSRLVQS